MRLFSDKPFFKNKELNDSELNLATRRLLLRPLKDRDFHAWEKVRRLSSDWLLKWEPRLPGTPYPPIDHTSFRAKLNAANRDREFGLGYGFGIFLKTTETFIGEITLASIQRNAFQSASIGYWLDKNYAGNSYMPEAVVKVLQFGFEQAMLHRIEINIVPTNKNSLRVVEKLGIRHEGTTKDYLMIDGEWKDHERFSMLDYEWRLRRDELLEKWIFDSRDFS